MRQLDIDDKVINELDRAKENNRLMHVYLFYGSDLKTMRDTAFMFACKLYCGCLNCPTCESILDDNHLNVKYIGIEDGKTLITKEQVNAIIDEFTQTSLVEGPRIYIIEGIDTASSAAQNSLLKFIEDPTMNDEVYGILIANELAGVLPTIKSRAGLIHFIVPSKLEFIKILGEQYSVDDAFILGSLTSNKELARNLYISKDYQNLKELFFAFLNLNNSKNGVLFYLENQQISVSELNQLLRLLISFYEESLTNQKLISSPLYDKIKLVKSNFSLKQREKRLETLLELEAKQNYNVIAKNILHELVMMFF